MRFNAGVVAALLGGLVCVPASASVQVWSFSGPITALAETPGNPLTGGAASWALQVTVDTSAPDLAPGDPVIGRYATTSVLTLGTLNQAFTSEMTVSNDMNFGGTLVDLLEFDNTSPVPAGWHQFLVQIVMQDVTGTAFLSDAIPTLPASTAFDYMQFGSIAQITGQSQAYQAIGNVNAFVPEPASVSLAGIFGLALLARRRPYAR